MAKILVTGGAGFIGSHCVDRLLERGDTVVVVDNFNDYYDPKIKRENIKEHLDGPNFRLVEADIANKEKMFTLFEKEKFDKVLHLAARAGVRPSLEDPLEYVRSNVTGTTVLLEACRKFGPKHFVFASSSSVYGGNKKVPFSEGDRVDDPYSPYAATKRSTEVIASNYQRIAGMHIAALRFFTVYGPRNRPDMAMWKFAKMIESGDTITIFGEPGEVKRDWTFIDDIVKGVIMILDASDRVGFEVFNIGCGSPTPVTRFVKILESELGKKANVRYGPLPVADVPITYADTKKINDFLEWKPTISIEEGIKKFVEWYKKG